jgi:acyl-CoA thioester hydrolase
MKRRHLFLTKKQTVRSEFLLGENTMNLVQELVREPESTAVIRFQDCDPFGHLNNARYIDYFMNARTDQIAEYYGLQLLQEEGSKSWVVTKSQIAYFAPARLMESVRMRTCLLHATERNLVVEGLMLNEKADHLKALLWIEFTYIDLNTGRPSQHPDELMQLLRAIQIGNSELGFEARSSQLRAQFRKNGRQDKVAS